VFGTDADEAQPAQQPDATPDAPVVAELPDVPVTDTSAPEVPVDTWVTQGSASLATAPETLTTPKGWLRSRSGRAAVLMRCEAARPARR